MLRLVGVDVALLNHMARKSAALTGRRYLGGGGRTGMEREGGAEGSRDV